MIIHPCAKCSGAAKTTHFKILEREVIDEIIFRTQNPRNRVMLELMDSGCMRVGEVLNLTPMDIEDRQIWIPSFNYLMTSTIK